MRELPAYCHACEQHIDIPLEDVELEGTQVSAICPVGKHFAGGPVTDDVAWRLRCMGIRSLADEATAYLANRTDVL